MRWRRPTGPPRGPDLVVVVPEGPDARSLARAARRLGRLEVVPVAPDGGRSSGAEGGAADRVARSSGRAVALLVPGTAAGPSLAPGRPEVSTADPLAAATLRRAGLVVPGTSFEPGPTESSVPPWLRDAAGSRPVAVVTLRGAAPDRAARALLPWAVAAGPRSVVLAGPRSFCAGVERAVEIVERALERYGAPVYVRRQIVHNAHVVGRLEGQGAVFVQELDEVPPGSTVVLSAHGVAPAVREQAAGMGLTVIDATCPLVAKVHAEARRFSRQGRHVVLIGHAGHDEVEGTLGEVPGTVVVGSVSEVERMDLAGDTPVALLNQTTLAPGDVADVAAAVRRRFTSVAEPPASDICYATQNRQDAVKEVARAADVVLVVGSANSSNSNRLVEVAMRCGAPAHLVEDETDLDPAWLAGCRRVGITAGASTPEALVDRVVAALGSLGPVDLREHRVVQENVRFQLPHEVR